MDSQLKMIIITTVIVLGLLTGLIIFWPKLTKQKLPQPINKFRNEVKGTKIGQEIFNVLGENTENNGERPLDKIVNQVPTAVSGVVNGVSNSVKNEITNIIVTTSSQEIVNKLNQLPDKEKEGIKELFCK